jgi:hypothetical protein
MTKPLLHHRDITSGLFSSIAVYEFDIRLGEDVFPCRIELFRDTRNRRLFRAHIWEIELFRMTPTSPMDKNGTPLHISDEFLLLERSGKFGRHYKTLEASSPSAALATILADIQNRMAMWDGSPVTKKKTRSRKRKTRS